MQAAESFATSAKTVHAQRRVGSHNLCPNARQRRRAPVEPVALLAHVLDSPLKAQARYVDASYAQKNDSGSIIKRFDVDWFFISHRLCIAEEAIAQGYSVHIGTRITSHENVQLLRDRGLCVHNIPFDRSASPIGFLKSFLVLSKLYLSINPQLVHLVTSQPVIMGGLLAKFFRINSRL